MRVRHNVIITYIKKLSALGIDLTAHNWNSGDLSKYELINCFVELVAGPPIVLSEEQKLMCNKLKKELVIKQQKTVELENVIEQYKDFIASKEEALKRMKKEITDLNRNIQNCESGSAGVAGGAGAGSLGGARKKSKSKRNSKKRSKKNKHQKTFKSEFSKNHLI